MPVTLPRPRTKPAAVPLTPAIPAGPVRRFTIAEFDWLIDEGILQEQDPYHLLNGEIRVKMPPNDTHTRTVLKLERRFHRMAPDETLVWIEKPIAFPNSNSQPQPDVAIVVGPETRYDTGKPHASDVLLIVEVSDNSLASDRGEMMAIYAGGKVPEYWIVNLVDKVIEVYTQPKGVKSPKHKYRTEYTPDQSVPVVLGGQPVGTIPVSEILP